MAASYVCAECGGTFDEGWSDELAQQEALETFGRRGDAPGMVKVCDDCYRDIMKDVAPLSPLERVYLGQLSAAFSVDRTALLERIRRVEDDLFINGATTGVPVGIVNCDPQQLRQDWNGYVGRSPLEDVRAAVDQERAQADEDAANNALGLMHGDGDE